MNANMTMKSETNVHIHTKAASAASNNRGPVLDAAWLRKLCLDAGADDVGFVELERPALLDERPHLARAFPRTRTLISLVLRMNRDNVRSPARSIANNEFHHQTDETNEVARHIVAALEREGIRALNLSGSIPRRLRRVVSWSGERVYPQKPQCYGSALPLGIPCEIPAGSI
jgi:hypothetical protein